MSWPSLPRLTRPLAALALAGLTAGCFQPLYGDHAIGRRRQGGVGDKLASVDVAPIEAPNGTRLARVSVEVRNELIYQLTGGGARRGDQLPAGHQAQRSHHSGDRRHHTPRGRTYRITASTRAIR